MAEPSPRFALYWPELYTVRMIEASLHAWRGLCEMHPKGNYGMWLAQATRYAGMLGASVEYL